MICDSCQLFFSCHTLIEGLLLWKRRAALFEGSDTVMRWTVWFSYWEMSSNLQLDRFWYQFIWAFIISWWTARIWLCVSVHTQFHHHWTIYIYVEVQWFTVLEITILLSALFFTVGDCWLLAPPNQPVLLRVINNCFILEFCFCEGRLSKRHFQQKHHSLSVAGHILTVTWTKSWHPWKSFPLIFNRIIH